MVTNLDDMPPKEVWRWYNKRANVENKIDELTHLRWVPPGSPVAGRRSPGRGVHHQKACRQCTGQHCGQRPLHQERTPSFTVNSEKGLFYCFGCGVSGDGVRFVSLEKAAGCGFGRC